MLKRQAPNPHSSIFGTCTTNLACPDFTGSMSVIVARNHLYLVFNMPQSKYAEPLTLLLSVLMHCLYCLVVLESVYVVMALGGYPSAGDLMTNEIIAGHES